MKKASEDREYSCGIFLDFSKAFDTVNHEILLAKLEFFGIRGIVKDWFTAYLSNRKQFVSLGNTYSDKVNISCGVPQGSVLGPLLFLIYINDFHNCSKLLDFHLFADDTNLFLKHRNIASKFGHYLLWDKVKFIDRDPHWYTRRVKEAIHIRLHPNK